MRPEKFPIEEVTLDYAVVAGLAFLALIVAFVALFQSGTIDNQVAQAVKRTPQHDLELAVQRHENILLECIQRVERLEGGSRGKGK